ncbi:phosphatidylinositol-specific phospholipase C domain-containing protein [Fusibacter sp. 3D3]|uniref:phosphatidylinositol-specific phospholipase C domain-containing protein n=1 Tax=Fusibacter sp. 3D3 TaxID=1048380 RepID=UPI000853E954|nr:phosphatidylinositol-specific phospholipase C domain-containing protein [Fusibacter sp. 3D3]GAU79653.1 phosphatidylinositol-specific phospholipase C [Fusibacter sp. 3D3]
MKYHDNEVYFSCGSKANFTLVNGTYRISSCSITEGQDPKQKSRSGNLYNFSSDGKLNFQVGRKASKEVADWLNRNITIDNSTFGHSADELNFAFLGILRIKLKNLYALGTETTIEFENIAIAQGNTSGRNNWWFGGRNCFNTNDNNCVHAIGKADDGTYYCAMIRRGGNAVNTYEVKSVEKIQPNWMANLNGALKLSQLSIPGTHDSGTKLVQLPATEYRPLGIKIPNMGLARCQNFSIRAQLYHGIRFLDIRLKYVNHSLMLFHGPYSRCELSFRQVLDWCNHYLHDFKKETILMSVKAEDGEISDAFRMIMEKYTELFLKSKVIPTLDEARGKIVLFSRINYPDNGIQLYNGWEENTQFAISTKDYTFEIEDHFNINESIKDNLVQKNIINAAKDMEAAHYYLTFNSLAQLLENTPYLHSQGLNKKLLLYLKQQGGDEKVGTILMDYYNNHGELGENELVETIISRN